MSRIGSLEYIDAEPGDTVKCISSSMPELYEVGHTYLVAMRVGMECPSVVIEDIRYTGLDATWVLHKEVDKPNGDHVFSINVRYHFPGTDSGIVITQCDVSACLVKLSVPEDWMSSEKLRAMAKVFSNMANDLENNAKIMGGKS